MACHEEGRRLVPLHLASADQNTKMTDSSSAEGLLEGIRRLKSIECGSEEAKASFAFDQAYTFLNHGARQIDCKHKQAR